MERVDGEEPQPSALFSEKIYDWLNSALDFGITERDFWDMTISELERLFESKRRMRKLQQQEKASYDYILAELIGRSIGRIYNASNKYPEIHEV
jgi:hypothetical protein